MTHLYPISLKYAIESKNEDNEDKYKQSGVEELFQNLYANIIKEKNSILFYSLNDKLFRMAETLLSSLKLKARTLEMPLEALEKAIPDFQLRLMEVDKMKEESVILLKGKCELIMQQIEAHIKADLDGLIFSIRDKIIELYKENTAEKPKVLCGKLISGLEGFIESGFDRWRASEDKYVEDAYAATLKDFKEELEKAIACINRIVQDVFNIDYKIDYEFEGIKDTDNLYYKIGNNDTLVSIKAVHIITLLPGKLANKWVLNHVLDMVSAEVRRNSGRVRSDYMYRINESKIQFQSQFESTVSNIASDISILLEQALKAKQTAGTDISRSVAESAGLLREVVSIYDMRIWASL